MQIGSSEWALIQTYEERYLGKSRATPVLRCSSILESISSPSSSLVVTLASYAGTEAEQSSLVYSNTLIPARLSSSSIYGIGRSLAISKASKPTSPHWTGFSGGARTVQQIRSRLLVRALGPAACGRRVTPSVVQVGCRRYGLHRPRTSISPALLHTFPPRLSTPLACCLNTESLCLLKDYWRELFAGTLSESDVYDLLKERRIPNVAEKLISTDVPDPETVGGARKLVIHRLALKTLNRSLTTFKWGKVLVSCAGEAFETILKAWEVGILHRDVSAHDIMIVNQDGGSHGILVDRELSVGSEPKRMREPLRSGKTPDMASEYEDIEMLRSLFDDAVRAMSPFTRDGHGETIAAEVEEEGPPADYIVTESMGITEKDAVISG
ncbi:hypothetical protein PQX77_020915 [Marasmius sp. AFHP31]|nr:hypothetical protein PQX77_020915 [Marasmius sp. AFHP31]